MSIVEARDGILVFRNPNGILEHIVEYSRKLINENEFFGAFGRIHSLIEFMMQNRYEIDTRIRKGLIPEELEIERRTGKSKIYRWRELVNRLLNAKLISQENATNIERFGVMRDRIMHRLMKFGFHPHEKYKVKKEEAVKIFEEGIQIVNLLRSSKDPKDYQWTTTTVFPIKKRLSTENRK